VRRVLSLLLAPLLLAGILSACGSGSDEPEEGLPTVSGEYGDKPKIKAEKGVKAGKKLQTDVLEEGDGPKVKKGDLLVADYLGQIYTSGKVFDNSYDRGSPAGFPIGIGQVIPGWDKALVGTKAGSRVLLVVPPKLGYGTKGNQQAGIKGTDSLVFVVDVIASYAKDAAGEAKATPVGDLPKGLPRVSGPLGEKPEVAVAKGTKPPTKAAATTLAKGDGPAVEKGKLAIVHFDAVSWAGQSIQDSWKTGPQGVAVGSQQPSPFDLLAGVPVGSRVLLTLPAQPAPDGSKPDPAKESLAVVVDVLAQHGPAKEKA
jgi:peptidylprolyl isomerase